MFYSNYMMYLEFLNYLIWSVIIPLLRDIGGISSVSYTHLSTQAADAGDGEATALHFARCQLTVTRFLRNSHQLARQLDDAFLVDVFEYRDNQTVRGIHRHTDVDVFLQGQTDVYKRQVSTAVLSTCAT